MKRSVKNIGAIGIAAAVVLSGLLLVVLNWNRETAGKHLAHVDWLPAEASDVTFVKREGLGQFTCYECNLPKAAFEGLASKKAWKLESKSDVLIGLRGVLGLPALKKSEYGDIDLVAKALFYENRRPNGGGITVVYDLEAGRLFVHESHR